VKLRPERIKYWLKSVGAKPSERCAVLFKKYMAKWEEHEKAAAAAKEPAATTA